MSYLNIEKQCEIIFLHNLVHVHFTVWGLLLFQVMKIKSSEFRKTPMEKSE